MLILVCAIINGIAGGALLCDPGLIPVLARLHPMVPSAVPFGLALMIVGYVVVRPRQAWRCVMIPVVVVGGFVLSAVLLDLAARHMQEGVSTMRFIVDMLAGGLNGMALIGAVLAAAGLLNVWSAVRFAVIGSVAAALCVVLVNCLPQVLSPRTWLFWSMCVWQTSMVCYFAWLAMNDKRRITKTRPAEMLAR